MPRHTPHLSRQRREPLLGAPAVASLVRLGVITAARSKTYAFAAPKPGDRSLDDPAVSAKPRGRVDALAGDAVADGRPRRHFRKCRSVAPFRSPDADGVDRAPRPVQLTPSTERLEDEAVQPGPDPVPAPGGGGEEKDVSPAAILVVGDGHQCVGQLDESLPMGQRQCAGIEEFVLGLLVELLPAGDAGGLTLMMPSRTACSMTRTRTAMVFLIGEVSGCRAGAIDTTRWIWTVRRQATPAPGG